ncbi:uncharacterized protein LOC122144556 [Cyprinus carpio]|uniref:Uncharacterized protein LOC122144556 n=1 Tax=Cyprinus carpio TaxID=7962 RepID=A0A9Q9Y1Z4_CYPCA|nr:uncharacterized protein LOC122144556 [Cyprinus carpio]
MTTGNEEEPERRKPSKSKCLEDKYRELERAGEFMRDVDLERGGEEDGRGDFTHDKEAMDSDFQWRGCAEEEDFEDCKEFWEGGVPKAVSGHSGTTEDTENGANEAPKGPLTVFCVIGQTHPMSQTNANSYVHPTVEEAGNPHSCHNMGTQDEMSINEAFEKVEHCEQDIERAMDDLSLCPNVEKRGGNRKETHSEDKIQRGAKEPTGDSVEHSGSDDTWSTCEERKRCSTAPHLRWAKNVVREILGLKSVDTENARGSVTHIDTQTNTQTEGEREMEKSRKEKEIIEGGEEQQGGMERELNENRDWLDPSSNQHTVSSEGEAEGKVEEVYKKKESKEEVVLSSSSFRDLGNEARTRRRGFRKSAEKTKEEEEDEAEEEGVGRDRRTRIFNKSDEEEDELCFTWSEMDLRKLGEDKEEEFEIL